MRAAVMALLLVGCTSSERSLRIDIKTDLVPGAEFSAVRIIVNDDGDESLIELPALFSYNFIDGFEAYEAPVGADDVIVSGALIDLFGNPVVSRRISVQIRGDRTGATLLFSRDCRDVVCPGPLDPVNATSCSGGVCVDPRCSPEQPETCRSECDAATDCADLAACSTALCVSGVCLYSLDGVACGGDERCDPELGCVAVPTDACFPQLRCEGPLGPYCADTTNDAANCGGCGVECTAPDSAIPRCEDGECGFACMPGTRLCGDECVTGGCAGSTFDAPTEESFEVPAGCDFILIRAWGAGGGSGDRRQGAAGGYATGLAPVTAGESLAIVVGSPGGDAVGAMSGAGGTPGGGAGGMGSDDPAGGGGGLTGVFRESISPATAIVIAGAGGGAGGGDSSLPGAGGGLAGQDGASPEAGGGGSADMGGRGGGPVGDENRRGDDGQPLQGGTGGNGNDGGGGGGAGWFGGGGSTGADTNAHGGGGGSGYAAPDVQLVTLTAGEGRTPALSGDPDRGAAAEPGQPGRVIIECLAF